MYFWKEIMSDELAVIDHQHRETKAPLCMVACVRKRVFTVDLTRIIGLNC